MDQEIRNKLRNVVTQCRKLLEDSVSQELEGKYGIFAKKDQVTADPNAKMTHLTEEEQTARKDILDHFGHIKARGFKPKEALDQLVREIAFTHLNRLCAYKMMEAREVYVGGQKFREAVSRGINSNGLKFYLADNPDEERRFNTGHQDVAYRHFLDWLGGLLSDEIGVLFNPNDPANRLYPRQKTLDEVLDLLNGGGIKPEEMELREAWPEIWSQDETIGWVYQYFTPKELRDQARKESAAPRNSYELAFRNQFFTPRYVVEFLTDNTLGRIWYEMRKGDTKLKEQCRYMVRRPTEIFLKEGEQPPKKAAEGRDDLSQEELLKLPVHIPHRPKKDPRELKILDPACGSGHFLLYCFDLLMTIYEEAYADPNLSPMLHEEYPTLEDLRRHVPRLILAHNLHGIDIDLRASQISALALWLRCQRAYQDMGLKKDRLKIKRSNFVCAEPMPGEEQMLKEFVGQLEPKFLGQVVEVVFGKMKLAGEAGSLLKIEEEIQSAVAAAKQQWVRETTQATDRKGQPLLFTQAAMDRVARKPEPTWLFDLSDITDAQFFERAEDRVVEALRAYAEKAENGQKLQKRLFSDDAVRGFAFVDLCHKHYDVVLMNPPFGECSKSAKAYVTKSFPSTKDDIYAAFVERGLALQTEAGSLGAISNKTGFFLQTFSEWRKLISTYPHSLAVAVDLGFGVLDSAVVETMAYVIRRMVSKVIVSTPFVRACMEDDKALVLLRELTVLASGERGASTWLRLASDFEIVPFKPFCYWAPDSLLSAFREHSPFSPSYGHIYQGIATGDNFRFLRCRWEVPISSLGEEWLTYVKGGASEAYYAENRLVVWWRDNGKEIKDRADRLYGSASRTVKNQETYGRPGLTYTQVTVKGFFPRAMPAGTIYDMKGPLIDPSGIERQYVLGVLASLPCRVFAKLLTDARQWHPTNLMKLPFPKPSTHKEQEQLCKLVEGALHSTQVRFTTDETSALFVAPNGHKVTSDQGVRVRQLIDETVARLYKVPLDDFQFVDKLFIPLPTTESSQEDDDEDGSELDEGGITYSSWISFATGCVVGRWDIRFSLGQRELPKLLDPFEALPRCSPGMLQTSSGIMAGETPKDYPLGIVWTGILADDPEHDADIVLRVRKVLELLWRDRAESVEKELCEILGVKELREYFRRPAKGGFWDDHIARYSKSRRRAPIYWLLQSSKKNYALWLYYHRLDKDLLFKALMNYVEPKIRLETSRLETLRNQKAAAGDSGKEAKRLAKEVERIEDFLYELRDFEDKLRRAANLHLEPDLNDGVVLNIAPLHELVPWKEAEGYWEELLQGKYEWSSIGRQLRQKGLVK
jgi:hypothetical protein